MESDTTKFEISSFYALVELMGHSRITGLVRQADIGDGKLVQVDAIDEAGNIAFSRIFSPAAIYAINPCTEEVALHLARDGINRGASPIPLFQFSQLRMALRKEIESELAYERGTVRIPEDPYEDPDE